MTEPIYLDHAALTPVDERVLAAMSEAARMSWGNPRSVHAIGRRAKAALAGAAAQIGDYLGCHPRELSFAASGTRALQLALDHALARASEGPVVSTPLEHSAVTRALAKPRLGPRLRMLELPGGRLELDHAEAALADAAVIVVSPLNHELGTVLPTELVELAPREAIWVIDAIQAAVWLDLDRWMGPRSLVVAASAKLGGPPGAAVLRTPPALQQAGEHDPLGEGTPPWLAAIGMGAACEGRRGLREPARLRVAGLGRRLLAGLQELAPDLCLNADPDAWVGPIVNLSFPGVDAKGLEHELDMRGVAIARGSACRSRLVGGSPVVAAAFPGEEWRSREATRWSLGWSTTDAEVDRVIETTRSIIG